MAMIDKLDIEEKEILWADRKRFLGMPLSFTRYSIDEDRLYIKTGFFRTTTDEVLLYRILDLKSTQSLGQKLCGVGTITLYSADLNNRELTLKNIKKPSKLHRYLSDIIETKRHEKGIAGREIVGTAGMPVPGEGRGPEEHDPDCCCHDVPDMEQ